MLSRTQTKYSAAFFVGTTTETRGAFSWALRRGADRATDFGSSPTAASSSFAGEPQSQRIAPHQSQPIPETRFSLRSEDRAEGPNEAVGDNSVLRPAAFLGLHLKETHAKLVRVFALIQITNRDASVPAQL